MISTWTDCAGRTVGRWKLDSLLGERDETAYYIGTDEETGSSALVHLVEADHKKVRESWELARTLEHPHILKLYACGDTYFDLTRIDYAVTEIPDDDLGEMLARKPLSKAESRSISTQASQGIEFLHQHNLCHADVRPATIFLVGDVVKLGLDSLQTATETGKARDLQQLWGVFPVETPEPQEERPTESLTPAEHLPQVPRARLPWAVVGVAGGAVLALLIGYRSYNGSTPASEAPKAVSAPVVSAPPVTPKPSPVQTRARESRPVPGPGAYAVVAATYGNYVSADIRAKKLNQQSKRLKAHVYPPDGKGGLYYVVLGAGLSQQDAEKLKRTARDAGAPRDTYVTKLIER